MRPNSYLVSSSYLEPAVPVRKHAIKNARSVWRRLLAIYKTKRNRFIRTSGDVINDLHAVLWLKKRLLYAGLSIFAFWHLIVRCFYYLVIFTCRFVSWISAPISRGLKILVPVLSRKYEDFVAWKDSFFHSPMGRIPAFAMMGAFTALILSINYFGLGLQVYIDGQSVGFVSRQDEIESVIHSVENRSAFYLNHPYNLNIDVDYRLTLLDKENIINPVELEETLFSKVNEISTLYVLTVDGKIIGANASQTAVQMVLDKILARYGSNDPNVKAEFVQDVSISEMPVANIYLKSASELTEALTEKTSVDKPEIYTVQKGDTASGIASKSSLKLSELAALNPELDPDKLSIGQQINLSASTEASILSVKQIKQISYTEAIPFETVTQNSSALYKNSKKVVVAGKQGQSQINAEVVMIDGEEVSRTIKSQVVMSEPTTQVVQVGTKDPPPKSPTGVFMYPFRGLLTSNYGYRHGEFHTGVDFAGPIGSRIVAADGGKVIFAGWKGNYGKCVIISHGNGLETLYGHCSSLLVKVGQQVGKGEQIAKVGSTGRSTGPHVHFEVRVNDQYVSPWKYLK